MLTNKTKKEEYLLQLNQYLVSFCHEFASVILKIPRVYVNADYNLLTDGRVIKVGNQFFEMSPDKQLFKLLQISMHVALRHPKRARGIYHNKLALKIWNVSTDLVINNAIEDYVAHKIKNSIYSGLEQEFTLTIFQLLLDNIPDLDLSTQNAEQVFEKIIRFTDFQYDSPSSEISQAVSKLLELLENVDNDFNPEDFPDNNEILKENGMEAHEDEDTDSDDLIWSKRIEDLIDKIAGTSHGTSILKLKKELPKVKVDWAKVMRDFLTARLTTERQPNWKRPNRRVTAGISEYFEPYLDKKKGIRKLALCWDISGSCFSKDVISKFVANIEAVHKITSCDLYLIPFDTEVVDSQVTRLEYYQKLSDLINDNQLELAGGGGTDFYPPISYAEELNSDVIVVLTDCYGPFPDQPRVPVLWATTGDPAPWGKTIYLLD